ncbi:MAG: exopolysaccharide biosynthesis polyprenyl glycosylphosphotransferase [Candidatus Omnitrophota bacterium]
MRKTAQNIRNLSILGISILACILFVTTAWATLSFVRTHDDSPEMMELEQSEIPAQHPDNARSRAPEPATILLVGFGMIVSIVRRVYAAIKRTLDILASIIGIIFLSPLFLITALLVKFTSKGPIIFTQTRVGKNGALFNIYKFRTMRVDAERETGPVWAAQNDNRLIPCGKFLRKAHLDELPQFVNILKGDMSLIGPRPERPVFVEKLKKEIPDYEKRLEVKPGLTGLAQVWHKYDETIEDVKKKVKYDLLYIRKLCLWTDVRILLRTVRVVFTGEGAR